MDFKGIPALGITAEGCERYNVAYVKTRAGMRFCIPYSNDCSRMLSSSGSGFWEGHYDASFGIFGINHQHGSRAPLLVSNEMEVLRCSSLGFNAVCIPADVEMDNVTMSIWTSQLSLACPHLRVWSYSDDRQRLERMERFLLHHQGMVGVAFICTVGSEKGQSTTLLNLKDDEIRECLKTVHKDCPTWRPQGITHIPEILAEGIATQTVRSYTTGFPCIDRDCNGVRKKEILTLTAGSGLGKSTMAEEIAYHLITKENVKVGLMQLENPKERTVQKLAAMKYNIPVDEIRKNASLISAEQWQQLQKDLSSNTVIYDHFGSVDSNELFSKIFYMIEVERCEFIILDHISIIVSGQSSEAGERKDIDILMTWLATTCVTKDIGFIIITHLKVPEGQAHEEGGRVTQSQMRGSGSIKQLSWTMVALERNQQDPNTTRCLARCLKCRETGKTGAMGVLNYDRATGRLREDSEWDAIEFERNLQPKRGRGNSYGISAEPNATTTKGVRSFQKPNY